MNDLIERLAREADRNVKPTGEGAEARLRRWHAEFARLVAEECAKLCDEKERQKWLTFRDGGTLSGIGPKDCGDAIRAKFGRE